jgi:hypothetical protein
MSFFFGKHRSIAQIAAICVICGLFDRLACSICGCCERDCSCGSRRESYGDISCGDDSSDNDNSNDDDD